MGCQGLAVTHIEFKRRRTIARPKNYAGPKLDWNRALQSLAGMYVDNLGDSARLFALVHMAMADAPIAAWDSELYFNFWRPVTAIQEGDNDLNRWTVGDPTWLPLIVTPPYPDYTSGANNLSGAVIRMLARYFRTNEVLFSLTSNTPQVVQKTGTYSRFSDAADEIVDARIYLGIHFRFADTVARRQGRRVADWAFSRFLRPLEDCDKDRDKRDKRDAEDQRDAWENHHGKK